MEELVDVQEQESTDAMQWDYPHYSFQGKPFIPRLYDGMLAQADSRFNAVTIRLDGRLRADLTWKKAREEAQEALSYGYALFWEMDLGLFDQLPLALSNQTQYLSLCLSLEHFRDTLWQEFKSQSLGLSLYRGNLDFSQDFPWDEHQLHNLREWIRTVFSEEKQFEQETGLSLSSFSHLEVIDCAKSESGRQLLRLFCRDVIVEYIALLASRLPDALPCYLFLDATALGQHPLWQAQLLNPERFEHLNLAIKNAALPFQAWGWESATYTYGYIGKTSALLSSLADNVKVGVCLPSMTVYRPSQFVGLEEALQALISHSIPFRLIAEDHLITNWDGLDYLLYVPTGLSSQGKRKLQGFCAAGGVVVSVSHSLDLPDEKTLVAFFQQLTLT